MTFSPRQTAILQRLLRGERQCEIARELDMDAKVVFAHVRRAADRMGIKEMDHAELLKRARVFLEPTWGQQ